MCSDEQTCQMRCAGASWGGEPKDGNWEATYPVQTFVATEDGDWTCTDCGWSQRTFESGVYELCMSATWHDAAAYAAHADIARRAGFDPPRLPPHQAV